MFKAKNFLQRGQILVMFAVFVPAFLAFLLFVADVGKTYLVNRSTQQISDSFVRMVDEILSVAGSSGGELVASMPTPKNGTSYESYAKVKEDTNLKLSPEIKNKLAKLDDAVNTLKTKAGVEIAQEIFIESSSKDVYYQLTVSKSYSRILKVASAADGESSGDSVMTHTVILKFAKDSNIITGESSSGSSGSDDTKTPDLDKVISEFNEANPERKTEIINNLIANKETEKINKILTANGKDGGDEVAEKDKSQLVLAILESDSSTLTDTEKGSIFNEYLSSQLNTTQSSGNYKTTHEVNAIKNSPNIDKEDAAKILVLTLNTLTNVSNIKQSTQNNGEELVITYKDSKTGSDKYHKVVITDSENGGNKIDHYARSTSY